MNFPNPQIGYFYSECCLRDLYKIETQEDLEDINNRVGLNDEYGALMVFITLDEAIKYLGDGEDQELIDETRERLK